MNGQAQGGQGQQDKRKQTGQQPKHAGKNKQQQNQQQKQHALQQKPLWAQLQERQQHLQRQQDLHLQQAPVLPSDREPKQPLLLYPASDQDLAVADQALATFVQEQLQQPIQTNKKSNHSLMLIAAGALTLLVRLYCPGIDEACGPETAAEAAPAAVPRTLPVLQHLSPGILAVPNLSSSDAALLMAPGFLQRVKDVSSNGVRGRIAEVISASFGSTSKAPAGAAKAAAAASSAAAAAGSGGVRQAPYGTSQLGLMSWFECARQQLMFVLGSPHPVTPSSKCTLSDSISAVLLRATDLARLVVQMHNLLLRGGLPQHELQVMQSWALQQLAQLAHQQLQMQQQAQPLFIAQSTARHSSTGSSSCKGRRQDPGCHSCPGPAAELCSSSVSVRPPHHHIHAYGLNASQQQCMQGTVFRRGTHTCAHALPGHICLESSSISSGRAWLAHSSNSSNSARVLAPTSTAAVPAGCQGAQAHARVD